MARTPSNAPSASLKATVPRGLAIQSKITLPADVSKSDAETYAKLSKLSGAEFDKAYANEMVKDHEKDVAEFQKEAINGKDPR
jgi:putative membrane protein